MNYHTFVFLLKTLLLIFTGEVLQHQLQLYKYWKSYKNKYAYLRVIWKSCYIFILKHHVSLFSLAGIKSRDAELMQNLLRVGAGPSSKTCPRWAEQAEQRTSVLTIPGRVRMSKMLPPTNPLCVCIEVKVQDQGEGANVQKEA